MFGIINFEVFLLSALLLNITPGPDTMYILGRSVSQGKRIGIISALGITAGSVIHTLLAAFGLSVILMSSQLLFTLVKITGAAYLIYLGIRMLLEKANPTKLEIVQEKEAAETITSARKVFLQGLITNVANPKVALFFLAFMPQFISPSEIASPLPFIILGLTFCVTGGLWSLMVASFSSLLTLRLRKNSKVQTLLSKITGIIFIVMGIKLLRTKMAG